MKKTVYLCGAINGKSDNECNDWRTVATYLLSDFSVLNPMSRDFRGKEDLNVEAIVSGDLLDIKNSDILLVKADSPSWGTAMEVYHAHTSGKIVIAFTDSEKVSPWLKYHTKAICKSLEDACELIKEFK